MTIDELWARRFHDIYEELAPSFGYETRTDTRVFCPESKNGKLMVAVCTRVLGEYAEAQRRACAVAYRESVMQDGGVPVDATIGDILAARVEEI